MTESKTPLSSEKTSESDAKVSSSKSAINASSQKKIDSKKSAPNTSSSKVSKLVILAVLIAVAAPSGHYYWQQLQNQQLTQTLTNKISEENNATSSRYQNQMQQALTKQQQSFEQQLQQVVTKINNTSQQKITELDATVAQLEHSIKQRQPSDWLLHEAEYLIRIAARTLWLEHDTHAATGLLKDAEARLIQLNDPAFLPVREVIHQDIKSLELMPKLQTDEIILTLMALSKQVSQLPLTIEALGKEKAEEADLKLSDNINDWQTNLAKTWQKFFNNFIRIRPRTGSVEPLISPVQQVHLKQNLSLKVQLALWAASERKGDIYQKSLDEIQQWLNEFFDMEDNINQHFSNALSELKKKQVNYHYPSELGSLTAIRTVLRNQLINLPTAPKKEADKVEKKHQIEAPKKIKTAPEKPIQLPAQQPEQQIEKSSSEGSL